MLWYPLGSIFHLTSFESLGICLYHEHHFSLPVPRGAEEQTSCSHSETYLVSFVFVATFLLRGWSSGPEHSLLLLASYGILERAKGLLFLPWLYSRPQPQHRVYTTSASCKYFGPILVWAETGSTLSGNKITLPGEVWSSRSRNRSASQPAYVLTQLIWTNKLVIIHTHLFVSGYPSSPFKQNQKQMQWFLRIPYFV